MSDGQISRGRAVSITHVEYEILQHIGYEIDISGLISQMVPTGDKVAEKRFRKGAENICRYLENMMERRRHKLPKDHEDYKEKVE